MYTQFYGFTEKPFNVTPDPKFLYLTVSHREALASMIYGITERRGYISITGEVGTGKTTLIYTLLNQLSEKVKTVCIFYTAITFEQLLKTILCELKISCGDGSKTDLLRQFHQYLRERLSQNEIIALIIDEAQNVPDEVLEEIRLLSNLETEKAKLLQILFVGQPEFEKKLDSENLRQLKQRIVIRRAIPPLTEQEIKEYIEYRLKLVGGSTSEVFTAEALSQICKNSHGIPRTINTICDNAFLIGYGRSQKKINDQIIKEVLQDINISFVKPAVQPPVAPQTISIPSAAPIYKKVAVAVFLLCFIGLLAFLARELSQNESRNPPIQRTKELNKQQEAVSTPLSAKTEIPPAPIPQALVANKKPASETPAPSPKSTTDTNTATQAVAEVAKAPAVTSTLSVPIKSPAQPANTEKPAEGKNETASTTAEPDTHKSSRSSAVAPPTAITFKPDLKLKKIATIQKGDSIFSLARKYYQSDNRTIIDILLQANPQIKNARVIKTDERFKIPEITESSLIIQSGVNTYKIHLATYASPSAAKRYQHEPRLKNHKIEVIPMTIAPREVFYRMVVGTFNSREECLKIIAYLKQKKLLPALATFPKTS